MQRGNVLFINVLELGWSFFADARSQSLHRSIHSQYLLFSQRCLFGLKRTVLVDFLQHYFVLIPEQVFQL